MYALGGTLPAAAFIHAGNIGFQPSADLVCCLGGKEKKAKEVKRRIESECAGCAVEV